ncbi:MAG: hypothetical protein KatS3mg057_1270 [Herpetosiphonaceae bacterium]|nr:MAG: hypothetical protein KatS3mg057_1270 [Herpetosiphonaceae bacterium]
MYKRPDNINSPIQIVDHLNFLKNSYELFARYKPEDIIGFLRGFNHSCSILGFELIGNRGLVLSTYNDTLIERGWNKDEPLLPQLNNSSLTEKEAVREIFDIFIEIWKRVYRI